MLYKRCGFVKEKFKWKWKTVWTVKEGLCKRCEMEIKDWEYKDQRKMEFEMNTEMEMENYSRYSIIPVCSMALLVSEIMQMY